MDQLPDYYNTISSTGIAEYKDRGSRFIAIASPFQDVSSLKIKLAEIKKEYPKASHYCYAYRLGMDNHNFRVYDDGEPSGTAGKPILGQIDSKKVTNVLIVVIRYFGGSLLGVPGLISAYKAAASMALQVTPVLIQPVLIRYHLEFDYTQLNDIMKIVKQCACSIFAQNLQLFCTMDIGIPRSNLEQILKKLSDTAGVLVQQK